MLKFFTADLSLFNLIIIRCPHHPLPPPPLLLLLLLLLSNHQSQGAAQSLRLAAPDAFAYLRCSACYTIDDVDDREEFKVCVEWSEMIFVQNKYCSPI